MPVREQPKPEGIEARVEAPAVKPEKPEAPRTDTRYSEEVSRYFNTQREIAKIGEEPGEKYSYEIFLAEQQRTLEKLAVPRLAEKISPGEVSLALSELAGRMASDDPNNPENLTGDPIQDAQKEKQYLEAKKNFMDSCAKMFPDIKADLSDITIFKRAAERIRSSINAVIPEVSIAESKKLLQDDPKELAKKIADVLHAGTKMSSDAWLAYTDPEQRASGETQLATAAEAVYKIQLMRDELQRRIYGRADITPGDARKIDTIHAKVKGEKPPEKKSAVGMTEEEIERRRKELAQLKISGEEQGAMAGKEQETKKPKPEEDPELGEVVLRDKKYDLEKDGPFKALYAEHKTPAEVKKAVTPEIKRLMLEKILQDIDSVIKVAPQVLEKLQKKDPEVNRVGKKVMGLIVGMGITQKEAVVYQKILAAAEGRVRAPAEIARMPVVEYLKRLGYNLAEDKKRAELLQKFTDVLS